MKPLIEQITDQIKCEYDNGVLRAVQHVGFNVDKEKLSKALIDSRSFYDEGYEAAKEKYEQKYEALEKQHKETIELSQKNIFRLNDALNRACAKLEKEAGILTKEDWKHWCFKDNEKVWCLDEEV